MKMPNNPPDFSKWFLTKVWSFFCGNNSSFYYQEVSEEDRKSPNWLAEVFVYSTDDGLAFGKEYKYFGKQALVRFWGLNGDSPERSFFAVLSNGRWECFSNLLCKMVNDPDSHTTNGRIGGCLISVQTRDERERELLRVKILRD